MPELPDCNPPSFFAPFPSASSPPDEFPPPVPALPPRIDPNRWEDFPTFRESFLFFVSDPRANITLRAFGRLLHELVLGAGKTGPHSGRGSSGRACGPRSRTCGTSRAHWPRTPARTPSPNPRKRT